MSRAGLATGSGMRRGWARNHPATGVNPALEVPNGAAHVGRHISAFAALRWLGVSELEALTLVNEARHSGQLNQVVLTHKPNGEPAGRFIVRRMPGNHADVYALRCDHHVAPAR